MKNELDFLQSWYQSQCDGEDKFSHAVKINALEDPGWKVEIILTNYLVVDEELVEFVEDSGWYHCWISGGVFHGAGAPNQLIAILKEFQTFVDRLS